MFSSEVPSVDQGSFDDFDWNPGNEIMDALGRLNRYKSVLLGNLADTFGDWNHFGFVCCDGQLTQTDINSLEEEANSLVRKCELEIHSCLIVGKRDVLKRIRQCSDDVRVLIARVVAKY